MTGLQRAIEIVGNQNRLAKAIDTDQQRVWYWLHKAKRVPAEFVLKIEAATGGVVSRHDLRPDLYPFDEGALAAGESE